MAAPERFLQESGVKQETAHTKYPASVLLAAEAINELGLGFSLTVKISEPLPWTIFKRKGYYQLATIDSTFKREGYQLATVDSTAGLKKEFFFTAGPFWSTARAIATGFDTFKEQVSLEDAKIIAAAAMSGVDIHRFGFEAGSTWRGEIEKINRS